MQLTIKPLGKSGRVQLLTFECNDQVVEQTVLDTAAGISPEPLRQYVSDRGGCPPVAGPTRGDSLGRLR